MGQNCSQINIFVKFCQILKVLHFFLFASHIKILGKLQFRWQFCIASTTLQFVCLRNAPNMEASSYQETTLGSVDSCQELYESVRTNSSRLLTLKRMSLIFNALLRVLVSLFYSISVMLYYFVYVTSKFWANSIF